MISVIIATKNGAYFIRKAVSSVINQTTNDIEIVIVSDGSTDKTVEIIKELMNEHSKVKLLELKENIGPGLARDRAIREAQGEYIAILDHDDEWISREKLEIQRNFLAINPEYSIVGSSQIELSFTDGSKKIFLHNKNDAEIRNKCLMRNQFVTSSIMFRKSDYLKVGGFSNLRQGEDFELGLKLLIMGKGANLDGCDTRYFVSPNGAHRSNKFGMNLSVLKTVLKLGSKFPKFYFAILKSLIRLSLSFF